TYRGGLRRRLQVAGVEAAELALEVLEDAAGVRRQLAAVEAAEQAPQRRADVEQAPVPAGWQRLDGFGWGAPVEVTELADPPPLLLLAALDALEPLPQHVELGVDPLGAEVCGQPAARPLRASDGAAVSHDRPHTH